MAMSIYQWLELLGFLGVAGLGLIVLHVPVGKVEESKKRAVPPIDLGKSFGRMKSQHSRRIADMSNGERELLGLDPSGYRSLTGKEHPFKPPNPDRTVSYTLREGKMYDGNGQ